MRHETAATRWKIISYFAILSLALGLGSPLGVAAIPIGYFLKDNLRLSPIELAGFAAIAGAPACVSFLFGFLRDRWRPSRWGDRGYLLAGGIGAVGALWLLKIPNASKSLEYLDSPTQYRRHDYARAIDRFSACGPIP